MQYTEFKIDQDALADKAAIIRRKLINQGKDPLATVVDVVMKRFAMQGRDRYTDYGPYWYALKDVLKRNGIEFGDYTDDEVAREYRGRDDFETVIAADMFRDINLSINPVGTVSYALNGYSGEPYTIKP